ncbi:MAG: Fic family protein [Fimbriimonadaceae bacterium]|nr:Fic family protein [Fimbriimonadaceae bacterium]
MPAVCYHGGGFPPTQIDWSRLIPLLGPAAAAVARYEGVLAAMPNTPVLLSPLTTQEAVLSSRIEGTQATFGEVLRYEAGDPTAASSEAQVAEIREVLNYRAALREAVALLDDLPLSQRVVRAAHRRLMAGVRGQHKDPGEYRRIQNWIGPAGSGLEDARYVPISSEQLPAAMATWERYLHQDEPDRLVQLAIAHAEFEALHPFLDGNGRLGRLLVPLFLFTTGLLSSPSFFLSAELEARRDEYYERLLAVSRDGDWTGWCAFFLDALTRQAEANQQRVLAILALYQEKKSWIIAQTRLTHAVAALDALFERPVFRSSDFATAAGIPRPTAGRILQAVRAAGLLCELLPASGRRPATLAFPELLNIAEGRPVF